MYHSLDFKRFIEDLNRSLSQPLPGKEAQSEMAPRPIDDRRFKEDPTNPARLGGVMVLLYHDGDNIRIPLMKRPTYNGAHSGQVSLPGGKHEEGDPDLIFTALRETEEEIGIQKDRIEVLGNLSEMFIIASNFKVYPTVGVLHEKPRFIPDRKEVEAIYTPTIHELMDLSKRKVKTMHFPPYTIESPYFDIEGEVVWGATAMILGELVQVINRMS